MSESGERTESTADGSARPPELNILAPGTLVGRYVLLGDIGIGGMGVIYKAYDPQLERPIALKLLRAAGDDEAGRRFRERLLREAQALAQLSHPNVVAVHDVGTFGEGVFIAMEFIEGQTLTLWLKAEPRRLDKVLAVFLAAGEGVAAAHRAGLVHRDFKPDNVLVGADGRVRVLDFGLARGAAEQAQAASDAGAQPSGQSSAPLDGKAEITASTVRSRAPETAAEPATLDPSIVSASLHDPRQSGRLLTSPLTRVGTIVGTPRFMAPEQHQSESVDARADQFSFCVSLYHAVYRQFPFGGRTIDELKDNVVAGRMQEPPANARVPRWLDKLVRRGLAARPEARHPSMDALLAQLARRSERERTRLFAAALGLAVAVGLSVWGVLGWRARTLERAQLCQGAAQRLAGVWDPAAKTRVRDALVAVGKPYAFDVWKSVEATLDRYAAGWSAMHRESCEATRLRGEQTDAVMTLRMVCLDRKRQDLAALVEVLGHADDAVLVKAAPAAAGLGSLDACADVTALTAEVPPPTDPALRARIAAIRAQLSRAAALRLAGRGSNAAELSDKAVAEARQTKYAPILAEALATDGRVRVPIDPTRAAAELTEAFWAAFSTRLDRVAIAAAVDATRAYATLLRFDDSMLWEKNARAGLERIGGDDEQEAELWTSLLFRAYEQHRGDEQLVAASKAARLSEHRFGFDDLRTINKQLNELTALSNVDRVLEAYKLRAPLLLRQEALLGGQHPMLARTLADQGDNEVQIGHLADARAHLGRAEKLYRDAGETASLNWTALRTYQVRLAMAEGRLDDAATIAKQALEILDRLKILDAERALDLQIPLARIEARRGHAAEAMALLRRLAGEAERSHGKDNMTLGLLLGAIADVAADAGKLAESRAAAERNLALVIHNRGAASFAAGEARLGVARAHVSAGEAAEALALVDESEPAIVRALGEQAPLVAVSRRLRGEALTALGRTTEAVPALQSAFDIAARADIDPVERHAIRAALDRAAGKSAAKPHVSAATPSP